MTDFLHFSRPDLGDEEINEVIEVLRSGWITTGPRAARFEEAFCDHVGARHALAVNSCTAGLHLALAALGLGPGDEVLTTPLTFCATVNVILQVGATPVLVDIGPDLNLDPARVKQALTPRSRAIVPVHFAGLPCRMDEIWKCARESELHVVEDAAHAAGARYRGQSVGAGPSDAVAFSFYATKNLTTGEGGMVTTPSATLAEHMRMLCLHGINKGAWNRYSAHGTWYYEVVACGFKYNMSDIEAAIGLHQLAKLDRITMRRKKIASAYNRAFQDLAEIEIPPDRPDSDHCWHLYVLRLNLNSLSIDRAGFLEEMRARGIGCSVHFIPIPLHPYYRQALTFRDPCSLTLREYPRMLSLPIYPGMTNHDVQRVIDAVREIVTRFTTRRQVALAAFAES